MFLFFSIIAFLFFLNSLYGGACVSLLQPSDFSTNFPMIPLHTFLRMIDESEELTYFFKTLS